MDSNIDRFELIKSGVWLRAGAKDLPDVSARLENCAEKCFLLNQIPPSSKENRNQIIKDLLGSIGEQFVIHTPFRCDLGFNIHIGNNFVGNYNLSILDEAEVTIGNDVLIGPNCCIATIIHAFDSKQRAEGIMSAKPVNIKDNVWIAANVTILPGVTIGKGTIVGAGSVVTKSLPDGVLAAGNPCKIIRKITADDIVAPIL